MIKVIEHTLNFDTVALLISTVLSLCILMVTTKSFLVYIRWLMRKLTLFMSRIDEDNKEHDVANEMSPLIQII